MVRSAESFTFQRLSLALLFYKIQLHNQSWEVFPVASFSSRLLKVPGDQQTSFIFKFLKELRYTKMLNSLSKLIFNENHIKDHQGRNLLPPAWNRNVVPFLSMIYDLPCQWQIQSCLLRNKKHLAVLFILASKGEKNGRQKYVSPPKTVTYIL